MKAEYIEANNFSDFSIIIRGSVCSSSNSISISFLRYGIIAELHCIFQDNKKIRRKDETHVTKSQVYF